jgi:hypothetical protein
MDLYKYHASPKILHGHHEAKDIVVDRILTKFRKMAKPPKDLVAALTDKQKKAISRSARGAYDFAVINNYKPWPEAEDAIAKNAEFSYKYAHMILNNERFPKGEDVISKDPAYAYMYAEDIIKGPWPKGEDGIAKEGTASFYYALDLLQARFPKGEKAILECNRPEFVVKYTNYFIKKRWPEAEEVLLKSTWKNIAYTLSSYAILIVRGRWLEAEPIIKKDLQAYADYKHAISQLSKGKNKL